MGVHIRQEPMQVKLTLRVDDTLIRRAKAYAKASGRSLSELVGDLFGLLDVPEESWPAPASPAVRSLAGALEGVTLDRDDYRSHLDRKHA